MDTRHAALDQDRQRAIGLDFDRHAKLQVLVRETGHGFSMRLRIVTPQGKLYGKRAIAAVIEHAPHLTRCRWMFDLAMEYRDLWAVTDVPDGVDPEVRDPATVARIEQFGRDAIERIAAHQGD